LGDVFQGPLDDDLVGRGQVAASYGTTGGHSCLVGFRTALDKRSLMPSSMRS